MGDTHLNLIYFILSQISNINNFYKKKILNIFFLGGSTCPQGPYLYPLHMPPGIGSYCSMRFLNFELFH